MYLNIDLLYLIKDFYFAKCVLYHNKYDDIIIFNHQINKGIIKDSENSGVLYVYRSRWKFYTCGSNYLIYGNYKKILFKDFDFENNNSDKINDIINDKLIILSELLFSKINKN